MRIFNELSTKQKEIARFGFDCHDALICDGAVRSGKTSIMMAAFVMWAMVRFDGCSFGVCGRAVQVAERNIVKPFLAAVVADPEIKARYLRSQSMMIVEMLGRTNFFYLFGGKDEASYTLIQGITLSGILFDEVALMPRSFVEQGITRTLSVDDAKLWFNCNPEHPEHWFYKEWIQQPKAHNAKYLHFTMADNPGLSEKAIQRASNSFSGVFYDRYINGIWVKAEGLIYPMFDRLAHTFTDEDAPASGTWFISIDYGVQNAFSAGLWCLSGNVAYRMAEYYHDGRKNGQRTDEEHADAVEALAGGRFIKAHIIDPSATSFIVCLQRRGLRVKQANNEVLAGISNTASALQQGRIKIHQGCIDLIRELGLYAWDTKAKEDKPIKENDHACDDMRYFIRTALRRVLPTIDARSLITSEHVYWTGKRVANG